MEDIEARQDPGLHDDTATEKKDGSKNTEIKTQIENKGEEPMPRIGDNIYNRRDGRFEGRYIKGRKENGKPAYGYVYGATYHEVKSKLAFLKADHEIKEYTQEFTVGQWLQRWVRIAGVFVNELAHQRYAHVIAASIIPVLGHVRLLEVDRNTINDFIGQSGFNKSTQADLVYIFKSALRLAENEQLLTGIADGIMEVTRETKPNRILSEQEEKHLTEAMLNQKDGLSTGVLLSLHAGLRTGEVCALRWEDLDLVKGRIQIRRSTRRVRRNREEGGNKTELIMGEPELKNAVRTIPIPEWLIGYLKIQSELRKPEDYILTECTNKYTDPRNNDYQFKKCMKKHGMEKIHFRTLRTTFEHHCIEAGMDLQSLNAILGRGPGQDPIISTPFEQIQENMHKLESWRYKN